MKELLHRLTYLHDADGTPLSVDAQSINHTPAQRRHHDDVTYCRLVSTPSSVGIVPDNELDCSDRNLRRHQHGETWNCGEHQHEWSSRHNAPRTHVRRRRELSVVDSVPEKPFFCKASDLLTAAQLTDTVSTGQQRVLVEYALRAVAALRATHARMVPRHENDHNYSWSTTRSVTRVPDALGTPWYVHEPSEGRPDVRNGSCERVLAHVQRAVEDKVTHIGHFWLKWVVFAGKAERGREGGREGGSEGSAGPSEAGRTSARSMQTRPSAVSRSRSCCRC